MACIENPISRSGAAMGGGGGEGDRARTGGWGGFLLAPRWVVSLLVVPPLTWPSPALVMSLWGGGGEDLRGGAAGGTVRVSMEDKEMGCD